MTCRDFLWLDVLCILWWDFIYRDILFKTYASILKGIHKILLFRTARMKTSREQLGTNVVWSWVWRRAEGGGRMWTPNTRRISHHVEQMWSPHHYITLSPHCAVIAAAPRGSANRPQKTEMGDQHSYTPLPTNSSRITIHTYSYLSVFKEFKDHNSYTLWTYRFL
jgi:hypothetical protein